uniref:Uncharacterized protein n=1 Tax=Plectus sambesii TaxID=2011161 RepID=A0A914WZK0_9BILA
MLRGGLALNVAKTLVNDSRATLKTQEIVEKTKSAIHNASEATKNMAAAAKEKITHPTETAKNMAAAAKEKMSNINPTAADGKPGAQRGDHRISQEQVAGGECNVGFGPQVGVGDKMHDRAGKGRVDDHPTKKH